MKFKIICLILIITTLFTLTSCDMLGKLNQLITNLSASENNEPCKHTELEAIEGYDATCTETGLTDGKKCVSCGEIIQEQSSIELAQHSFDDTNDKVCNSCGFLNSDSPTFLVSEVNTVAGTNNIAVTVSLKNNPGIASIVLSVLYDDTAMELTRIEYNTEIGGQMVYPQDLQSPVTLYWINGFADTTGDWILATLYFNISESKTGEYDIQISYNPDNVYNISEENLNFEVIHGKIVIE